MKKVKILFFISLLSSCQSNDCRYFDELYLVKSCHMKVDTLYQVSPNHEYAIIGFNREGKKEKFISNITLELYRATNKGDSLIKERNNSEAKLIKVSKTLIFNYECKDKKVYLNNKPILP